MLSAVLTADIVNSTRLSKAAQRKLMSTIESLLKPYLYEFYRGDSFQVYITPAENAMRAALQLRSAARRVEEEPHQLFDVRISIGIGKIKHPIKNLALARAEPFILSGRIFDEINRSGRRLMMACGDRPLDIGLEILSEYTDQIFDNMTSKQAAVIFELLSGATQKEVAKKFKKSPPTINKQVHAAGWLQVESILNKFDSIIKLLSS